MSRLLTLTAIIEAGTGLALLVVPPVVVQLLLSSTLETSAAVTLGRIAGAALLALGVTCWLARDDTESGAARGLVAAIVLYNVGAVVILGAVGIRSQQPGFALWPVVALHSVMAVWCVASLVRWDAGTRSLVSNA